MHLVHHYLPALKWTYGRAFRSTFPGGPIVNGLGLMAMIFMYHDHLPAEPLVVRTFGSLSLFAGLIGSLAIGYPHPCLSLVCS